MMILILLSFSSIAEVFNPTWLCLYYGDTSRLGFYNLASKVLLIVLTLALVRQQGDAIVFAVVYLISAFLLSVLYYAHLRKRFVRRKLRFVRADVGSKLKKNFLFFVSRSSTIVKDRSGVLVLGLVSSVEVVALYDLLRKFIDICLVPFTILNSVIYRLSGRH